MCHLKYFWKLLETQLIQIIDDTITLPLASVINPSILTYTIGTNGLQYPMDLQPWIFVKTSGKISTKSYPGATYVGTALNYNTLILKLKDECIKLKNDADSCDDKIEKWYKYLKERR